jgi:long-chain fatty acid transport protein
MVLADDNHYQNYLIGERALGLGGAFTAISDDASGTYYNPAGLVESAYSSLSLATAVYGFVSQSYAVPEVNFTSDNRNFISYPTTAAWIQRVRTGNENGIGRIQLALSLITPQSNISRQRLLVKDVTDPSIPQISGDLLQLQVAEDDALWVGFSGAWKAWKYLSVGATAFTTVRFGKYKMPIVGMTSNDAQATRWIEGEQTDLDFSSYGLLGLIGIIIHPSDHLNLGVTFRTPSLELHQGVEVSSYNTMQNEQDGSFRLETGKLTNLQFHDRQPFKAAVGSAYLMPRQYGVSLDFSIYGPVDEYSFLESASQPEWAKASRMKKRLVWQFNIGGEYYLTSVFPVRLGFFTDRSSLDYVEECNDEGQCIQHTNLLTDAVDHYGVAGSIGYEREKATLNLGWLYSFGSNTTRLLNNNILETSRSFFFLALGGAFRF